MSSQPVHLQYNSPMQLYSKESAEEQFQQQVGSNSPIPLPAPDKHFDPAKSATLRYLKEGDHSSFGENFAEKIAAAEAPRVPYEQEPGWASYAREKSERARSRTPADPSMHRSAAATPTSQHHHVHHETPWEHAEKSRTYTHATHPDHYGPAYYQVQHHDRQRRGHSVGADRGYELGGMDYTKGLPIEKGDSDYYYESHRSRKEDMERKRPGYELGGSDFGKGYVSAGPYHGHGPDPPRLRPHYSADPRSSCNVYSAPNVDGVDANLLVGDTLSNQKIRHEVRNIDHSKFGTSFAPAEGFKRDHHFHSATPPPNEPVTFSSSGKQPRSASAGYSSGYTYRSSAPVEQQNVWTQRQSETDREVTVQTLLNDEALAKRPSVPPQPHWEQKSLMKHEAWKHRSDPRLDRHEIYTTEPNWSRTVQQRRGAWERKAFDTEARVNLPATAKVPPPQPPAWHRAAQQKHQVWQSAADHVQGHQPYQTQQQYQQQQYTQQQQQQQQQYQPAPPQQQYTESHSTVQSQQHYQPFVTNYTTQPSGNNAMNIANTGFNQNQLDYMQSHLNKYNAGQQYAGQMGDSYSSTSRFGGSSQHQEQKFSSESESRKETVKETPIFQDFNIKYSSRTTEEIIEPVSGIRAGTFAKVETDSNSVSKKEEKMERKEETVVQNGHIQNGERIHEIKKTPSPYFSQESIKATSQEEITSAVPQPAVQQSQYQESSFHKSSSSSHEERSVPVQRMQTQFQETSYRRSASSHQEHLLPVQPVQNHFQESSYRRSASSHEQHVLPVQPVQNHFQDTSYRRSASINEEYLLPVQPVQNQFQVCTCQNSINTHRERSIPVIPTYDSYYKGENHLNTSSFHHHERAVTVPPAVTFQENHYKSSSSIHEETALPVVQPVVNNFQESRFNSSSIHEERSLPVQPAQSHFQESSYKKSSSTHEERSVPVQPAVSQFQQSYQKSSSTTHEEKSLPAPVQPPVQSSQFQESYHKSSSSSREERSIPVQPITSQFQQSYQKSSSTHEEKSVPVAVQPAASQFQQSYQKSSSSTREEKSIPVQPVQSQFQQSYQRSTTSTKEEKSIPVQPVQTSQFQERSYHKSSSSSREERTVPVKPVVSSFQESYQKSSSTQESSRAVPVQPVQQSQQFQSYKSSSSTQESRALPVQQPAQTQYQESYKKTTTTEESTGGAPLRPVQPIQTNFQESFQKSSSSHETSTQPRFDSGLLATHGGSGYTQSVQSQQLHSPGSYKSFHSSHYSKQETTTSSTKGGDTYQPQVTTTLPITKNTSYSYSNQSVNQPQQPTQIQQSSTTTSRETQQRQQQQAAPVFTQPAGSFHAQSHHSYKKEEETSSRPTSQLSHYSQHSSYNKKREERTETRTTPAQPLAPLSSAQGAQNVYSKIEMNETLPLGSLSNTQSHTQGGYRDKEGHDVFYKKDLQTAADPGKEYSLLKEEEKRTVETPLEPGVISRHVTTKYYKKKTVTDTTTTTAPEVVP